MGKGKRGAAEYIKTCRSPEILNEILDRILSHEISINDSESIDWIRWLMAGGNTPENFTAIGEFIIYLSRIRAQIMILLPFLRFQSKNIIMRRFVD